MQLPADPFYRGWGGPFVPHGRYVIYLDSIGAGDAPIVGGVLVLVPVLPPFCGDVSSYNPTGVLLTLWRLGALQSLPAEYEDLGQT